MQQLNFESYFPSKYDDEIVDGQTLRIVETRTNKSFWLSTDLLISYGSAEVLRNGKWINPPTIYDGKEVSPEEALKIVTDAGGVDPETGRVLPEFDSMEAAVAAAEARSASLGPQDDPFAL